MGGEHDAINYMFIWYTGEPETSARHEISVIWQLSKKESFY